MSTVWRVAVPVPVPTLFDYLPAPGAGTPAPGCRVRVPFGRQSRIGYLIEITEDSPLDTSRLKSATALLDHESLLCPADLGLLLWAARYYHHAPGEVVATAFPSLLRKGEDAGPKGLRHLALTPQGLSVGLDTLSRAPRQALLLQRLRDTAGQSLPTAALAGSDPGWSSVARKLLEKGYVMFKEVSADLALDCGNPAAASTPRTAAPLLNAAQANAVHAVTTQWQRHETFLLQGVTGSGKTEVYLELARYACERGQQTLLLLPEIGLTPQIEERFRRGLGRGVPVFHSRLGERERREAWLALQGGTAPLLLGTRSAVFIPMRRPGLIVVDEEHDASYKQQDGFRFSARDIAIKRAHDLGIPIMLGSATPSLETLWNGERGRYRVLHLPDRAAGAALPAFGLIDLRRQRLHGGLSRQLIEAIRSTLQQQQQVLLFINRRGYAPTLICEACGWVCECRSCDARLVIHRQDARLRCHHCGYHEAIPPRCPECGAAALKPLGLGTERIEESLQDLFPDARSLRIDRDTTASSGSLSRKLADVHDGSVDILIGTQMLAKGHHFPRVTLVGVLDADAMLFATDFRAGERTAQLLVQVAGRAGRAEAPGTVLLQTRNPEHPLLRILLAEGYAAFAQAVLAERRGACLPPFGHLAIWRADALDPETPAGFLEALREHAQAAVQRPITVLGPAPAPMPRQAARHRYQLWLQSADRPALHGVVAALQALVPTLPHARRVRWSVDIDPIDCY